MQIRRISLKVIIIIFWEYSSCNNFVIIAIISNFYYTISGNSNQTCLSTAHSIDAMMSGIDLHIIAFMGNKI